MPCAEHVHEEKDGPKGLTNPASDEEHRSSLFGASTRALSGKWGEEGSGDGGPLDGPFDGSPDRAELLLSRNAPFRHRRFRHLSVLPRPTGKNTSLNSVLEVKKGEATENPLKAAGTGARRVSDADTPRPTMAGLRKPSFAELKKPNLPGSAV